MGKSTGISWTDHTFNPWWGCTKVSPGCDHCYAETMSNRVGRKHWGKGEPRRVFQSGHWDEPMFWNKAAEERLTMARVFTASMADIMDDEAPAGQRERLWQLIDKTPWLYWMLLTKRPHRYERYLPTAGFKHGNVMLGCTAENTAYYNARFHYVTAAARRLEDASGIKGRVKTFVSYEPALGPLSLERLPDERLPDQVIFGGETGPHYRAPDLAWARNLRDQCAELRVAFFMKQASAANPKKAADLIPADLLIRQTPYFYSK